MNLSRILLIISIFLITSYMYIYVRVYSMVDNKETKLIPILFWTTMFDKEDFNLGLGSEIFNGCPFSNCFTTTDRNLLDIKKYSAIIFHHSNTDLNDLPASRNPEQRYIFFTLESPSYTSWKPFDNFYNWTMTYRLDSDIVHLYGYQRKQETGYRLPEPRDISGRKGKIAWLVSNCITPSGRENIADEINKYMPVDVIGDCNEDATVSCPKTSQEKCYKLIEQTYKFYLSFENSLCKDYVTEKFFNILKLDLIPIVFGNANYSELAPSNSFINVRDYRNVSDLVKYLKKLDDDPNLYLKYLEWKKEYVIDIYPKETLCDLCEKLNKPIEHKTYSNLSKWWLFETCEQKYEGVHGDSASQEETFFFNRLQ